MEVLQLLVLLKDVLHVQAGCLGRFSDLDFLLG